LHASWAFQISKRPHLKELKGHTVTYSKKKINNLNSALPSPNAKVAIGKSQLTILIIELIEQLIFYHFPMVGRWDSKDLQGKPEPLPWPSTALLAS